MRVNREGTMRTSPFQIISPDNKQVGKVKIVTGPSETLVSCAPLLFEVSLMQFSRKITKLIQVRWKTKNERVNQWLLSCR